LPGHSPSFGFDSHPTHISVLDWGVNWELALQDCVLYSHEKIFRSNARFAVEKADNDLSRARLPGSEKKKARARAAGAKFLALIGTE